jgi:hypothetical protein
LPNTFLRGGIMSHAGASCMQNERDWSRGL